MRNDRSQSQSREWTIQRRQNNCISFCADAHARIQLCGGTFLWHRQIFLEKIQNSGFLPFSAIFLFLPRLCDWSLTQATACNSIKIYYKLPRVLICCMHLCACECGPLKHAPRYQRPKAAGKWIRNEKQDQSSRERALIRTDRDNDFPLLSTRTGAFNGFSHRKPRGFLLSFKLFYFMLIVGIIAFHSSR